jgi:hypothetical protein
MYKRNRFGKHRRIGSRNTKDKYLKFRLKRYKRFILQNTKDIFQSTKDVFTPDKK